MSSLPLELLYTILNYLDDLEIINKILVAAPEARSLLYDSVIEVKNNISLSHLTHFAPQDHGSTPRLRHLKDIIYQDNIGHSSVVTSFPHLQTFHLSVSPEMIFYILGVYQERHQTFGNLTLGCYFYDHCLALYKGQEVASTSSLFVDFTMMIDRWSEQRSYSFSRHISFILKPREIITVGHYGHAESPRICYLVPSTVKKAQHFHFTNGHAGLEEIVISYPAKLTLYEEINKALALTTSNDLGTMSDLTQQMGSSLRSVIFPLRYDAITWLVRALSRLQRVGWLFNEKELPNIIKLLESHPMLIVIVFVHQENFEVETLGHVRFQLYPDGDLNCSTYPPPPHIEVKGQLSHSRLIQSF